jgi:hypothetical protein
LSPSFIIFDKNSNMIDADEAIDDPAPNELLTEWMLTSSSALEERGFLRRYAILCAVASAGSCFAERS